MRYADILLIYAEAENELNGPTADAIEKVNEVRRRARKGMPSILIPGNTPYNPADVSQCPIVIPDPTPIRASSVPADVSGLTYEQLKETILFDRVKELLMEGSDRFDLVRLGPDAFMHYLQFPKKTKSTKGKDRPTIVELDENCEEIKSAKLNYKIIDTKKVSDYTRKAALTKCGIQYHK